MKHFGEIEALHPKTILKVYNNSVGMMVQDMIVALCRQIALLEEKIDRQVKNEI